MKELVKNLKVGQMFRSKNNVILLRVMAISKKEDVVFFNVADSDYAIEGPLSNVLGLFRENKMEKITKKQWDKYLLTYTEDIEKHNAKVV